MCIEVCTCHSSVPRKEDSDQPWVCMVWAGVVIYPTVRTIMLLKPRPNLVHGFFHDKLTWWSAVRWSGAWRSPGPRDFMTIRVHAPAEAGAAMTLQWQEVALLVTLGDVDPGTRIGVLSLSIALLVFTGFQS